VQQFDHVGDVERRRVAFDVGSPDEAEYLGERRVIADSEFFRDQRGRAVACLALLFHCRVLVESAAANAEQQGSLCLVVIGLEACVGQLADRGEGHTSRTDAGKTRFAEPAQQPDCRDLIEVRPLVGQNALVDHVRPDYPKGVEGSRSRGKRRTKSDVRS